MQWNEREHTRLACIGTDGTSGSAAARLGAAAPEIVSKKACTRACIGSNGAAAQRGRRGRRREAAGGPSRSERQARSGAAARGHARRKAGGGPRVGWSLTQTAARLGPNPTPAAACPRGEGTRDYATTDGQGEASDPAEGGGQGDGPRLRAQRTPGTTGCGKTGPRPEEGKPAERGSQRAAPKTRLSEHTER